MNSKRDYKLGQYEKSMPESLDFAQKLEISKSAGFDYLEISVDESEKKLGRLDFTRERRIEFRRVIEDSGHPVITMCLSAHRKYPLGGPEKSLEIGVKAVDLAFDLGIRVIQLAGYDVYYEPSTIETKKLFLERLERLVRYASQCGVALAFETMETDFMNTCGKAMHYVNLINSPYLGLYPDVGNVANSGVYPPEDFKTAEGHILAAHLKETLPGVFREVEFGKGGVDFKREITALMGMGVSLFTGEFWYNGAADIFRYVRDAHGFLRACFETDDRGGN